jgi:hypothetical protein
MFTKIAIALAALAAAGVIGAGPAGAQTHLPAFCSSHSGAKFNPVCGQVHVSGGGAFADADGDGVLNGVDTNRTGGPGGITG